ncbi:amidohydrolase family protein [Phenylobacterium montanum]|uniref:Amidohydrolase family protein n=1 Tax=Phenylobacterium montanum TaxID=2823693 RepID=A0A975IUF2_9CAUL|nr:amidohydrolase family protein [Caulobacter sp. S6]QUD87690.1 amidohydrolase family protein [Caulobacter sp. S6]
MIDAHQHFWRLDRNDCAWPTPDLAAIHRDFGPADLKAAAEPLGVTGSILVQSQSSERDTDWLLGLAAAEPFILGVVGWTDLAADDAPGRIAALAKRPKLVGLRPMLQGLDDDAWIASPAVAPALDAMARAGLALDALVFPRHLPHLSDVAKQRPDLTIVIDHAAKPPIAEGRLDPWRDHMARLAELPQVWCKLSGLLTEASPGAGAGELEPYVQHLLQIFGPERLIWGSDWPVLLLAGDYAAWLGMAQDLVASLGEEARAAIFETNARRAYRLGTACPAGQIGSNSPLQHEGLRR